jgi:chromodomain-helicase-DNA-binding protein 1
MMATSPGHMVPPPSLTNGHGSPYAADTTATNGLSPHSESDMSDSNEHAAAESASDVDAPGEEDDEEDVEMAQDSDSSDDVDAEGEADGDYDSDSPPPEQAESDDARSSASQESPRPLKRKSSPKGDDYITQNPELYGLRRSVCGLMPHLLSSANSHLGSRQASSSSRKLPKRASSRDTYRF